MRHKVILAAATAVAALTFATNAPAKNINGCVGYQRLGAAAGIKRIVGIYGDCGGGGSPTSATPEPSTWALMAMGSALIGGVFLVKRRRLNAPSL
jgi:hypothetical protein